MSGEVTSRFGLKQWFRNHRHNGIDFNFEKGTPMKSIKDGYVEKIVDYGGTNAGKTVFIRWEDGKTAIYGHLDKFLVKEGEPVSRGDVIALSGNSGHVVSSNGGDGSHLHFGLKDTNGKFIDPSPYIKDIQNMSKLVAIEKKEPTIDTGFSMLDMLKIDEGTITGFLKMLTSGFINFLS